jgi:hypothetical protein
VRQRLRGAGSLRIRSCNGPRASRVPSVGPVHLQETSDCVDDRGQRGPSVFLRSRSDPKFAPAFLQNPIWGPTLVPPAGSGLPLHSSLATTPPADVKMVGWRPGRASDSEAEGWGSRPDTDEVLAPHRSAHRERSTSPVTLPTSSIASSPVTDCVGVELTCPVERHHSPDRVRSESPHLTTQEAPADHCRP